MLKRVNILSFERAKIVVPFVMCLALLVCATLPEVAQAAPLWDVIGNLEDWIKKQILGVASACFGIYFEIIKQCINASYLTNSFNNLFGAGNVYSTVQAIYSTGVQPVAQAILAFLMLVQLIKISQKIDATSTLPAVKDIVFLAVFFAIFTWLINNALPLMSNVYDIFNHIAKTDVLGNVGWGSTAVNSVDFSDAEVSNSSIGACVTLVIIALLCALIGLLAFVVVYVVSLARCIQLYVMAAFSPIPLALLGFDETRSAGVAFIKNFCAAALAGVIMVFLLVIFPSIVSAIAVSNTNLGSELLSCTVGGAFVNGISAVLAILKWLAVSVLLIVGLVKSGAWAKEIMGA